MDTCQVHHYLARCNASSSYQFTLPNCLLIKLLKCCLSCSAVVAVELVVQIGWMLWMLPMIVSVPQLLWSSCGDWWATTHHHLLLSCIRYTPLHMNRKVKVEDQDQFQCRGPIWPLNIGSWVVDKTLDGPFLRKWLFQNLNNGVWV